MGKVFATCGHEISDVEGFGVKEIGTTREGKKCINYPTLCGQCFKQHLSWGIVLSLFINGQEYEINAL